MMPTLSEASAALTNRDAAMRDLWEKSDLSAEQIGRRFGVTKNSVIGTARRRDWAPRREYRCPTLMDRMDALHTHLDAVLRETVGIR